MMNNNLKLTLEKPNNPELEDVVLGTILIDNTAIYKVMQVINPHCFYQESNKHIFNAIMKLQEAKSPIDILTVTDQLKKDSKLEDVGGPYRLVELTNRIGSAANVEHHANILFQYFIRRELITNCDAISRSSYDSSCDIFEVLEKARKKVFSRTTVSGNRVKTASDFAKEIVKRSIEMDMKYQEVRGIASGYEALDMLTSGWIGGRLYIIGGRPSMGKTTFVINVVKNAVKKFGKKGLFVSGEMSGEDITTIIIASDSKVPMQNISKNAVTPDNWERILKTFDSDFESLFIDDTPKPSISHVWSEAVRLKEQHDIEFVVIDYIQLMTVNARGMDKKTMVSLISSELKALSRHLGIPVIALSQLSRQCENRVDKRPVMSDLKETGDIEQDADFIAFLYRPEYYGTLYDGQGNSLEGIVEFIIRKNRHGALGTVLLDMKKDCGLFSGYNLDMRKAVSIDDYDMSLIELKSLTELAGKYNLEDNLPDDMSKDDLPF